ncbi:MAG TPA: hypothetical protein VJ840_06670 [Gemmatimonadaceae bacterium]|nr:hypothetical protein [Gemmatimonadaceae bacterium]
MPETPQRPYVPHRTPTRAQPAVSAADFTLAKPFVPDSELTRKAVMETAPQTPMPQAEPAIASIESFLVTARSEATGSAPDLYDEEPTEEPDELPPLEHFLDPLPAIADFSPNETGSEATTDFPDSFARAESRESGADTDWVATDWQRYDWQSAAALGETEKAIVEASDAWATTDWEISQPRKPDRSQNPADAIALALDQIAERIRKGDLSLPGAVADPTTIAATLAALLGVRR